MSLLVSEKKMVSSWAQKSIPTKYEGLPVTGMITSSCVERLNGIPRTASWDENSRNCCTAAREKIRHSLYLFTRWDNWALTNCKAVFSFIFPEIEKEEWENRNLIYTDLKTEEEEQNPTQNIRWCGQVFLLCCYCSPNTTLQKTLSLWKQKSTSVLTSLQSSVKTHRLCGATI